MKGGTLTTAILTRPDVESVHRFVTSDEALEAAAEESALSYTYQTSAEYQCCS
jgi:hypothetical protein